MAGARGERRKQLTWLMSGGRTMTRLDRRHHRTNAGAERVVTDVAAAGIAALPVSIGIGILKYRLYEIDRLISRTLSYAILTGLLVGVFLGIVALATDVLPFSSPVGVAASTLAAAALFNPLRLRRAAARRPALQPRALRRGGDRRRVHPAAARRGRPRHRARRALPRSIAPSSPPTPRSGSGLVVPGRGA